MQRPIAQAAQTAPGPEEQRARLAGEASSEVARDDRTTDWIVAPRTVAVLATAVAAVLALVHLGHKSLWLDEGYSVGHAGMSWQEFWNVLATREQNGALHSLLLFGWIRVADAEWWLRLPSAMAAVATVPLLYLLLRRLFDDKVAALGATLLAVNAFWLQFAQEARPYALALCIATASTLLLVRYVQDGRRDQWWAWVLVSAMVPFAHLFGLLVLAVQAVGVLVARRGLPTPRGRLLGGFVLIAMLGGQVLVAIALGDDAGQAEGIPSVTAVRFVGVYARLVGNGGVILLALVGGLWIHFAMGLARDLTERSFLPTERQWGALYLCIWLLLPTVAIALVSPIQPLFGARYFLILIPAAAGLTAVSLAMLRAGQLRTTLVVAVMATSLVATGAWYLRPASDDVRAAADTVAAAVEPGDTAVFLPWFLQLPFDHYAGNDERLAVDLDSSWPRAEWGQFVPDHRDHPAGDDIDAIVRTDDRVWVLARADRGAHDERDLDSFRRALEVDHEQVVHETLDGLDVYLFERR